MSLGIYFHSPQGGLTLRPESVAILFQAMGWSVPPEPAGTRTLLEARVGLEKAKRILQGRELDLAIALEQVVDALSDDCEENLEWA